MSQDTRYEISDVVVIAEEELSARYKFIVTHKNDVETVAEILRNEVDVNVHNGSVFAIVDARHKNDFAKFVAIVKRGGYVSAELYARSFASVSINAFEGLGSYYGA